jgi:hypothetical protein
MKVIKHKDKWYLQSETGYKEILLSTDAELTQDGIQPIDDDFLEWFVKNPSCERVEVELFPKFSNNLYGIIIPQEEPKQETLELPVEINFANEIEQISEYDKGRWYGRIEGAKWQHERMYSEEDLLSAFEAGMMFIGEDKGSFREWFEQQKKK